ncbi:zinc finger CCCH domain-containing protein 45-like [Lolium rigidum]|uniref:zinc finger CCCH domain-containing protein 45-like n=1 Tax=Lolium rigidum TaxID=89674 RepID=UPI001F5E2E70|nr:zinc finger CCCH domain-containing protein 45-like [Lolium rigidum]
MDGDDGHLVFDFEEFLDGPAAAAAGSGSGPAAAALPTPDALGPAAAGPHRGQARRGGTVRQTVCRHWLRGLCMKGDSCDFLHQYDLKRMPVCHFFSAFGYCREEDCSYKHITEDLPPECSMYNMGFCPNGPFCQHRHVRKPGPPPPPEEVVKKLLQMESLHYGSSSGTNLPRDNKNSQQEKPQVQPGSVLKSRKLAAKATPVVKQPAAHPVQTANPQHVPPPNTLQKQQQNVQVQGVLNGSSDQATVTASPPPQGQSRYSVVKSCNQEDLGISVQQGIWASQKGVMVSF